MMMVTIRCTQSGVLACIPKVDADQCAGYPTYEVLGEHVGTPPEHATWVDGSGWVVDEEVALAAAETARINALTQPEMFAELMAEIATLRAELDAVRDQLPNT